MDDLSYTPRNAAKKPNKPSSGPWYWPLTLLSALLVSVLSMLMAYLTAQIPERSPLLMGLIFMVPAGTMFFSAMLLEFKSGAMTPSYTRRNQVLVACLATVLTFACGSLCDLFYTLGGHVDAVKPNVILVVDDTGSMWDPDGKVRGRTRKEYVVESLDAMLGGMDDGYTVGMVVFDSNRIDKLNPAPLSDAQRGLLAKRIDEYSASRDNYATMFNGALHAALDMAQVLDNGRQTRIVLLTDGEEGGVNVPQSDFLDAKKNAALQARCQETNAVIYSMSMFTSVDRNLSELVHLTGGECAQTDEPGMILEFMQKATKADGDMLRAPVTSAAVYSGIMLILEGLIIGVCLSLMLSVQGQLRAQMLLSPLMGLLAFLLIKVITPAGEGSFIIEGLALSLLGVVFMTRNNGASTSRTPAPRPRTGRRESRPTHRSAYDEDNY